jgi:CheY-like chemotaxis protein
VEVPVATAVAGKTAARPATAVPATPLEDVIVLCIENEPQVLAGMEALLSSWGTHVLGASDLETALDLIKKSGIRPDVLLIDYHLDEGNGVDAIVRLRQDFGADLPAVLITADRSPKVREDARTIAVPVLNKPVKPAALRAFLAQWRVARPAAE